MANITCQNMSKKYGTVEVVEDFNIEIHDKEFVVFLGPSGSGKSTILRMIAGLEEISGGDLNIDGVRVNDMEPRDRGIAMVFQNYALYPHMTIYNNIAFGLRRLKTPEAEIKTRIEEVTKILGLEPVIERKPSELSGGQQQRVAIARAMIKTPSVFLFDEPLSNLDAKLRSHMRVEIAKLHKQLKTTSVFVTHDQLEAMTLADRIVLLDGGQIEQVGSPEEIYHRPRTLFAAKFIGTPAMNITKSKVEKTSDGWQLTNDGFSLGASADRWGLQDGTEVMLGIRPSDLIMIDAGNDSTNTVTGVCDRVEFHGDQSLVTFVVGGEHISALVSARTRPNEGDHVSFKFDQEAIHVFDETTGLRLER